MSIVLLGSTSGSCTLQEQAVAGTTTLTLPTFNGTVGLLVSGTAVASTSGTSIDFTGIPAGVRRITVMFNGVSTSGTSGILLQIGAGSVTTSGYASTAGQFNFVNQTAGTSSTTGFFIYSVAAANTASGQAVLTLVTGNTWVGSYVIKPATSVVSMGGGDVTLSGTLDRIRLATVNGTDTFDAGSINILYE
jgi:hypothetical protein